MDVEDLLYTDKEGFGHLLAEFVQGPAMPLRHGLVGSFGVDASNQETVFAGNDLHGVVFLNLEQLEEGLVEDQTAAVSNLLELLNPWPDAAANYVADSVYTHWDQQDR